MSDDGLGIHLIWELKKLFSTKEKIAFNISSLKAISLLEVGTSPLYYLEEISRTERLIVIDAMKGGEKPGSIYKLKEGNLKLNIDYIRDSHGYSILQVIKLAREFTGLPAKFSIYGVEPKNLSLGEELSEKVKNIFPKLIKLILKEIIKTLS